MPDDPNRVVGYNFYFSLDPDLPKEQWQKVTDKPFTGLDFEFDHSHLKPGTTYYVYAKAINGWGIESPPSEVVANTVPIDALDEDTIND